MLSQSRETNATDRKISVHGTNRNTSGKISAGKKSACRSSALRMCSGDICVALLSTEGEIRTGGLKSSIAEGEATAGGAVVEAVTFLRENRGENRGDVGGETEGDRGVGDAVDAAVGSSSCLCSESKGDWFPSLSNVSSRLFFQSCRKETLVVSASDTDTHNCSGC